MNQEKIGKFIKDLRIKNNLTQKEFADKYNVTYQAVSKWENGKNMPDLSLLKDICKDFDVSLDDSFNGEKSVKESYKKYVVIGIIGIIYGGDMVVDSATKIQPYLLPLLHNLKLNESYLLKILLLLKVYLCIFEYFLHF